MVKKMAEELEEFMTEMNAWKLIVMRINDNKEKMSVIATGGKMQQIEKYENLEMC